tara:strand:- start:71 stop:445 length:375 start_codon:yes stop_codon:yes gene_type:complete
MEKDYSSHWKASKQPRKQRKYRANAPLHIQQRFLAAHVEKTLAKKHEKRTLGVRKGDTVKIMRGQFKGKTGKILRVDTKNTRVYLEGLEVPKRDGTKAFPGVHVSNLLITELQLDDKKRLQRKK